MRFTFQFFIGYKKMTFEVQSKDAETHSLLTPFEPILREYVQNAMIDFRDELRKLHPELLPPRQPWNERTEDAE